MNTRAGQRSKSMSTILRLGNSMSTLRVCGLAMFLLLPAACSNAPASTPNRTDETATPGEPNIATAHHALDTQGFFQARGYFTNLDTVAGDCVVAADGTDAIVPVQAPNTGGQEVTFSLALIESSSDLQKSLSVSASASAKFLIGGIDAKYKFAEETHTTDTTSTLLASVVVRNTSWTAPPGVKLRDDVLPLLRGVAGKPPTNEQLARFRARCGDGFIQSYTTGGEFRAIIQVQTSSKDEKDSVSASIAGHYLSFSASADFEAELRKIVSSSSTLVRTYQIGGDQADTAACADVSCVTNRIKAFTTAVAAKPVVFDQQVKAYSLLALPNDAARPKDITITLDMMSSINTQRNSTRDLLLRLLDVQTNSENYVLLDNTLSDVSSGILTLNSNLSTLNNALKVCGRTPDKCAIPSLASVSVTVPSVKPLPAHVMLRGYARPSYFIKDGYTVRNCGGVYGGLGYVLSRPDADLATFNLVPGLNAAPGAISLQNAQTQMPLTVSVAGGCYGWTQFGAASNTSLKNLSTFYRVKGLNGKPNTWSFRLWDTQDAYLALRAQYAPIRLTTVPAEGSDPADVEAFKDNASFYVDAQ